MGRDIFLVMATIVDSNGAFHVLDGYPKAFDSKNYADDVEKARKRALGEFHSTIGTLCSRDDRKLQTVTITNSEGCMVDTPFTIGTLYEEEPEE